MKKINFTSVLLLEKENFQLLKHHFVNISITEYAFDYFFSFLK